MEWNKKQKPPTNVCPEKYCFNWVCPGGIADVSNQHYDSFEEAVTPNKGWKKFPQGGCHCPFGVCTRIEPENGDRDWYEPFEMRLEKDGLPWFYFISSTINLVQSMHEKYLRESQALWTEK